MIRGWKIAVLGLVAVLTVSLASWSWTRPDPVAAEDAARVAQDAAEQAVVPIVSYDYRTLDADRRQAEDYMTSRFRTKEYAPLWDAIKANAVDAQTVITAKVVGSAIVSTTPDRVRVLVFVDRPTSNKDHPSPILYEDHVTLVMVKSGDRWLVDNLSTT